MMHYNFKKEKKKKKLLESWHGHRGTTLFFLILCVWVLGSYMGKPGAVCSLGRKPCVGLGVENTHAHTHSDTHRPVRHTIMAWLDWHGLVCCSFTTFPCVCEDFVLGSTNQADTEHHNWAEWAEHNFQLSSAIFINALRNEIWNTQKETIKCTSTTEYLLESTRFKMVTNTEMFITQFCRW